MTIKRKIMVFLLVLICLLSMLAGCVGNTEQTKTRAKCGGKATTTISGTAETLKSSGIPLSACRKITSNIYSADVCGSCTGPVAELTPNMGPGA